MSAQIFHRLVRDPAPASEEDSLSSDEAFADALRSTDRFFARMPGLSVKGKTVLDYGCGIGATPFWLVEHGARRAVGIDIQVVTYAKRRLEAEPSELRERISFGQMETEYESTNEQFDLILSKDTFEHVGDPDRYVAAMKAALRPGGEIAIGFGPLWKSPWGGHVEFMTRMPWAHLLFPEQVILAERRRFRPEESPSRFEEIRGGLNRMTLGRFLETMARSGLEQRYLATHQTAAARTPARRALINAMRLASSIPPLREYFTPNVYSVWTLRAEAGGA